MAQLNSVFTFRGKVGNAVGMKGKKGKTNVRTLVVPANPKTDKQMAQRAALGTASQVASHLYAIIGQSFQNKKYGLQSYNEFVRQYIADINAMIANGGGYPMIYNAKNLSFCNVSAALISAGNLPSLHYYKTGFPGDSENPNALGHLAFFENPLTQVGEHYYLKSIDTGLWSLEEAITTLRLYQYPPYTQLTFGVFYHDNSEWVEVDGHEILVPEIKVKTARVRLKMTLDYTIPSEWQDMLIDELNDTNGPAKQIFEGLSDFHNFAYSLGMATAINYNDEGTEIETNDLKCFSPKWILTGDRSSVQAPALGIINRCDGVFMIASSYNNSKARRSRQRVLPFVDLTDDNAALLQTWLANGSTSEGTYYLDLGNKTTY